jgi:hypothetical protein
MRYESFSGADIDVSSAKKSQYHKARKIMCVTFIPATCYRDFNDA